MLIIVACQFVAPKVGVASPLILLVVGLAIGFLPQVGAIEIEPNIILEMVLPPLLFSAAVRMPTMDFRREMQAVAMLAIPLVFLSAFASLRSDPVSRAYYQRKRDQGKRHNQAVLALAHRRILTLHAMIRDGALYDPQPATKLPAAA